MVPRRLWMLGIWTTVFRHESHRKITSVGLKNRSGLWHIHTYSVSVFSFYCHWDASNSYKGSTLKAHWTILWRGIAFIIPQGGAVPLPGVKLITAEGHCAKKQWSQKGYGGHGKSVSIISKWGKEHEISGLTGPGKLWDEWKYEDIEWG